MRLKRQTSRATPDNTIPLINIVFLMLIFFLFAGTIARDDARQITPPKNISEDEDIRSTGALVIDENGNMTLRSEEVTVEGFLASQNQSLAAGEKIRIAADDGLKADELERILRQITAAEKREIVLITRKPAQ